MCGCENHWNPSAPCTCRCPEHASRRSWRLDYYPAHRNNRPQDACSLVCRAESDDNCTVYVGRHRRAS